MKLSHALPWILIVVLASISVLSWQKASNLERAIAVNAVELSTSREREARIAASHQARIDSLATACKAQVDSVQRSVDVRLAEISAAEAAIRTKSNWLDSARKREEGKFHEVFKNLKPYHDGVNDVGMSYVKSFESTRAAGSGGGYNIHVKLVNETGQSLQPNYEIVFVDEYGFVTNAHADSWVFNSVGAGETRYHEGSMSTSWAGGPHYFFVKVR